MVTSSGIARSAYPVASGRAHARHAARCRRSQQRARRGAHEALGTAATPAAASTATAAPSTRRPRRAVRVGGDQVARPERRSSMPQRCALDAVRAGERGAVDLQRARRRAARPSTAPSASISGAQRSGCPISVPNPRARTSAAAAQEPVDVAAEQRRLDQHPAARRAAPGRSRRARASTRSGDVLLGELGARAHLERHAGAPQRGGAPPPRARAARRGCPARSRSRTCGVTVTSARPVGDREPRQLDRLVEVDRAVVDARAAGGSGARRASRDPSTVTARRDGAANLATTLSRFASIPRLCATTWPPPASASSSSTAAWARRSSSSTSRSSATTSCPGARTRRSCSTAPT